MHAQYIAPMAKLRVFMIAGSAVLVVMSYTHVYI